MGHRSARESDNVRRRSRFVLFEKPVTGLRERERENAGRAACSMADCSRKPALLGRRTLFMPAGEYDVEEIRRLAGVRQLHGQEPAHAGDCPGGQQRMSP